jgi:hypothetical protein
LEKAGSIWEPAASSEISVGGCGSLVRPVFDRALRVADRLLGVPFEFLGGAFYL